MGAQSQNVDYSSVEKPLAGKHRDEAGLVAACIKLWRPLAVVFMYWILQWERSDLTGAFLRTRVECPPPEPDPVKGHCPKGSQLSEGACVALPPGSHNWSGSSHCANQAMVVAKATAIGGQMSSCSTICSLVAQIFVGSMLVDSWGRKPVMLLGLLGSCICSVLFFVSCFLEHQAFLRVMFVGIAIFSLANAFPAATLAMASDLSRNNIVQRGLSYSAIFIVQHVGILTAFTAGYFILAMDLTDYREVWGIFLCICVGVVVVSAVLLRETLGLEAGEDAPMLGAGQVAGEGHEASWEEAKHGQVKGREGKSLVRQAVSEAMMAFKLVWQDMFLRCSLGLTFLANVAATGAINITGGYAISVIGLTQAVASLAGVFQPAAIVCGSSASTWLLTHFGPYVAYFLGMLLVVIGLLITGLGAVFDTAAEGLFWTGWVVVGLGWGMAAPSHSAFNSVRIPDKNDHGKLFAAVSFVSAIGSTIGSLIWTNYIFSFNAVETWRGGLGYFVSAVVVALVLAGYFGLWFAIIRPERQERADAASSMT